MVHCGVTWFKSQAMNINTIGEDMAIPSVDLVNSNGITFIFVFHRSISSFTCNLLSDPFLPPLLFVSSPTCSVQNSNLSSSFEVYFSQALFVFPHSEFKKFKAFLAEAQTAKEAA